MTYKISSAASDVSLAPFGLRIIRAMQPSAARGKTAEWVAKDKLAPAPAECWMVVKTMASPPPA